MNTTINNNIGVIAGSRHCSIRVKPLKRIAAEVCDLQVLAVLYVLRNIFNVYKRPSYT